MKLELVTHSAHAQNSVWLVDSLTPASQTWFMTSGCCIHSEPGFLFSAGFFQYIMITDGSEGDGKCFPLELVP